MKAGTKRILALTGSALMVAGMAAPAAAGGKDDDRGRDHNRRCSIELDQHRNTLTADVSTSERGGVARVEADFDSRRGDDVKRVWLDRRGDASVDFSIPRGADSVTVSVTVRGTRISCDADLDLGRGRPGRR